MIRHTTRDTLDEQTEKKIAKAEKTLKELAPEWYEAIQNATDDEIIDKLGEVVRLQQENARLKSEDPHLKKIRGEMSGAVEQYREAEKVYKAKQVVGDFILSSRGK